MAGKAITLDSGSLGRPTQADSYANSLQYAPSGPLTALAYGNGVTATYGYNTRNLLDTTRYRLGGSDLTHRSLSYDANGNLKTISDSVSGPVPPPDRIFADGFEVDGTSHFGTDPRTFTYDVLDRLTRLASSRYGNDDYTYDPLGNVRTATAFGIFHYDANNRMVARNADPYSYDTRGNLASGNGRGLTWNRANELVADSIGNGYTHDARGWRVKRTTSAAASHDGQAHTRYYLYDANHTLVAIRDNGVWRSMLQLGGKTIARIDGNTPTYILPNFQNSPLFETSNTGSVTQWAAFLGYGRALPEWRAMVPTYTGTLGSATTGEYYLGARYLFHKRFTSPDPAPLDPTSPTGMNRYAYGADDPVNNVDPLGLCVKNSDPECNPKPTLPQPIERRPEVSRSVQRMRNASNQSTSMRSNLTRMVRAVSNGGKAVGKWVNEHISISGSGEGGAAFGVGAYAEATKEFGRRNDSIGAAAAVGEGAYAGTHLNIRFSWGQEPSSGGGASLKVDPGSYYRLRLGAGVALGLSLDLQPVGGSFTISPGIGVGEAAIVKPPLNVGVEYNVP